MIVGVQGTSSFNDYQIFLRAMGVALSGIKSDDNYIYIYTAGPKNINDMVMEFTNLSDRGLKGRGIKIKMFKVAPEWLEENCADINYFAYLCNPRENQSKLFKTIQLNNIEYGLFNS